MAKIGSKFNKYSYEFKVQVVKDYLSRNSGGLEAIAQKYGLKSNRQVRDWLKLYQENPKLLSQDRRGRPKSVKLEDMVLKEQVEYLKMENAILKKLRALRKT